MLSSVAAAGARTTTASYAIDVLCLDEATSPEPVIEMRQAPATLGRKMRVVQMNARRLGDAGQHLRRMVRPVVWPQDDPDSDYE